MLALFLLFISVFAQTTPSGFYCKLPEVEPAQFRYLSLSDIGKEDGSDSDSSSGNDDDEKDVSKMKCVTADSTGVYKFGSDQLSVGSEVKIYGQKGHKIVVDLSSNQQTALTIEAEEGALGSLSLNVPASGNVKSVTFGSNVNAATVEFKLVEAGKTVGSAIQFNGNVKFTFKYEVATGSTINYANYRTVEMPASTSYVIVFDGIVNVATTTLTKTNVKVNAASYKLPTEVREGTTDNYVMFSLQDGMIAYRKVTKQEGYVIEGNTWKFKNEKVCYEGSGCVMKESSGYYTINIEGTPITGGTIAIEAEGGHKVNVKFNATKQYDYYLKKGGVLKSSDKTNYNLMFVNNGFNSPIKFENMEQGLTVSFSFMKAAAGVTGRSQIYMKGACTSTGNSCVTHKSSQTPKPALTQYNFFYDATDSSIDFSKYSLVIFQESDTFEFNFNLNDNILFDKKETNIAFDQSLNYVVPEEKKVEDKSLYHYYEKGTLNSWYYPLIMTRTKTKKVQDDSSSSVAPSKPVVPPVKDDSSSSVAPSKPVVPPVKDDSSSSVAPIKPVNPPVKDDSSSVAPSKPVIPPKDDSSSVAPSKPVNPPKVEDSSDDSSSEPPKCGPNEKKVEGYYHTGDFVYKYNKQIDTCVYEGKYVVETNGTYIFGKANFYPTYKNWEKLYLWAKDGHKFHFNIDIQGLEGADFEFFGENGQGPVVKNVTKKTKYSFDLPCFDLHYGLHFFQTTDTIDLNFKKCAKNYGKNLYVKNFGEGNLTLHYKVHYEVVGTFANFDNYQAAIFQKGISDTMEVMDLPAVTSFAGKTNIGIDGPAPIPTVPSGNGIIRELVHVRFTDSSSAWYGWLYYIVYKDSDKANMKKGYWRPANTTSTYSYTYSDYVHPDFEKNGGLVIQEANNKYTLTEKNLNPHKEGRPIVLIPTGKNTLEFVYDRKVEEGVDPTKVWSQVVFVRTNTPLPTKDTNIRFKFVPSNARGALTIQQEEKAFDVPIVLNFDRTAKSEDEHPTKVYVKGNYAKYIERRDKEILPTPFETIKYDVIYDNFDFNAKQSVAFTSYKKVCLQSHVVESTANITKMKLDAVKVGETIGEKLVGIKLNNINFGGKFPQFNEADKIDTNIYANPNTDEQMPIEMSFQPQKYDATHNIIYTLYRENKTTETVYKIKSKLVETGKPAPSSASSIFIAALIMLFAFLF